ncbi:MAG: PfkB family carbohydrate kinase, partial [Dehalococcoidia bacterium]
MPAFDVIGVGALNMDRIYSVPRVVIDGAQLIDEVAVEAGGCSANTTYALAKLGLRAGIVCEVGDDDPACQIRRALEGAGVDCSMMITNARIATG